MNKTTLISLLLLIIGNAWNSKAESNPALEHTIDSLITLSLQPDQPGGFAGLISQGETIFLKAYGMANLQQEAANTLETPINLASVSKHFTAYAILLLEQEGKIKLDDNVREYLPQLPDYGYKITIRQLLHHTSGIASTDNLRLFAGSSLEKPWDHDEELELIYKYPTLNFIPGEQYVYSNSGYSLLATVIEKISGLSYDEYLQKKIFDPLNMNNTFVYDQAGKIIPGKASGYEKGEQGFTTPEGPGDSSYGSTNIYTSAIDLGIWAKNFFEPKTGNKEVIERIFNKSFVLNDGDTISYSYGMIISQYKGMKLVSHSGGDIGYRSQLWIFPEHEVVIFATFNTDAINSRKIAAAMADSFLKEHLVIDKPKERVVQQVNPELLQKYNGSYRMPDGVDLTFVAEPDTFWLEIPEAPRFQLFAESDNHFFLKDFDAQVTFIMDSKDEVNEIIWHQGGNDYQAFRAPEAVMPDPQELKEYAGIYYHEALNVEYPIEFVEGELVLSTPDTFKKYLNIDKVVLTPMGDDRFLAKDSPLGVLLFSRGSNNEFTGFQFVDVGRLKNVAFKRIK